MVCSPCITFSAHMTLIFVDIWICLFVHMINSVCVCLSFSRSVYLGYPALWSCVCGALLHSLSMLHTLKLLVHA